KPIMKQRVWLIIACILITAAGAYAQETKTPEDAQRLTTAQITKIDAKKKVLTVRSVPDNEPPAARTPPNGGGRPGGGGRRGGRGGRGGNYPFPGGGGGGHPSGSSQNQGKEFKVTVTDKTTIKDSLNSISFGLLRVGDRITIHGLPKKGSSDLEAT